MDFHSLSLILASGSPRRKEILTTMGLKYTIDVSEVDEHASGTPREMVLELSGRKAKAVAGRHQSALVLAADTLVYGNGQVLGKPGSAEHAFEMLRALSGTWHEVYTGLTLINTRTGECVQKTDCTRVHFVQLTDSQIKAYITTGEPLDKACVRIWDTDKMVKAGWMDENGRWKTHNGYRPECLDKAGAYGIQGQAGMFIDRIEGSYSNVVGLPMAMLRGMLLDMLAKEN